MRRDIAAIGKDSKHKVFHVLQSLFGFDARVGSIRLLALSRDAAREALTLAHSRGDVLPRGALARREGRPGDRRDRERRAVALQRAVEPRPENARRMNEALAPMLRARERHQNLRLTVDVHVNSPFRDCFETICNDKYFVK